ncbi:ferredoxin [Mycobacterium sp. MS1601]|uniref:indolepyruvate ferredoxin oxidoreductase subunit alpha n=1 Tax=Mycobacterium sp. MS1601 TaxID=1936029 RepID=UPI0009792727|nr:4Fe-4S dicluster domain-containing protein [Mycobacterium sp. MS1601]AQA05516.1 ferredoxin [Mycobacterium sp. MS1601]
MPYVITSGCLDIMDRNCMDQCPVDAIYAGQRMAYIHPDECIDCGACVPACPQSAIFLADHVPDEERQFVEINSDVFASGVMQTPEGPNPDHPTVAHK